MQLRYSKFISKALAATLIVSQLSLGALLPHASFAASTPISNAETFLTRQLSISYGNQYSQDEITAASASPEQVLKFINTSPNVLAKMEVLRQAYWRFGSNTSLKTTLLTGLKQRYLKSPNNAELYFDYGWAQVVVDGNKNGLFFLRKADDALKTPVTSLAYGMAEVDADVHFDQSSPEEYNTRKMDVVYRLKDALARDKQQPIMGLWPTLVGVRNAIKDQPAYESFGKEDLSLIFIPTGKVELAQRGFQLFTNPGTPEMAETQQPNGKKNTRRNTTNPTVQGTNKAQPGKTQATTNSKTKVVVEKPPRPEGRFKWNLVTRSAPKNLAPTPQVSPTIKVNQLSQVVAMPSFAKKPVVSTEIAAGSAAAAPQYYGQYEESPVSNNTMLLASAMGPKMDGTRIDLNDLMTQDASVAAQPYGTQHYGEYPSVFSKPLSQRPQQQQVGAGAIFAAVTPQQQLPLGSTATCDIKPEAVDPKSMKFAVVMQLNETDAPEAIEFYNPDITKNPYYVRVLDITKRVIGQFYSPKAPFIMEDLDHDGTYELVVRQYHLDPLNPVFVYRWVDGCYQQDNQLLGYFQ